MEKLKKKLRICLQDTYRQGYTQPKSERIGKNEKEKQTGVAVLISEKLDLIQNC